MEAFTQGLLKVVQTINMYLSDYVLIVLLIGIGLYFTVRTRFVQVRCFGEGMKRVFGGLTLRGEKHGKSGMTSFQALATAIAAQVGTGNIVGACGAILVGGDDRDLELARQVAEFGVEGAPLPQQFGPGARVGQFVGGGAGELVGTDVADAVAEDESFSVDFLQKNSQPMLYKEHSDNDGLGGSSSGKQSSGGISSFVGSSQNSFSNNDAGNKDASNNDKSDNEVINLRKKILKSETDISTLKSILDLFIKEYGIDEVVRITKLDKKKIESYLGEE